ncbi:MAG: hypothetical protein JW703_00610 [Candidatus Diapherotrites archaeon]|nr:hypothetical protein [Candidatus Diapherotrites archaeon]
MSFFDVIQEDLLVGAILLIASAVFLLSGLGWLVDGPFFGESTDIIISFILLLIGAYELFYKSKN